MSGPGQHVEDLFTVFEGSSPDHVSHARLLWSSMSLLPPLESRLESADTRQRLPVSRPQRGGSAGPKQRAPPPLTEPAPRQREEERRRYAAMADRRKETLALLRRQREQRVRRETLSPGSEARKPGAEEAAASGTDCELVKQLQ